MKSKHEIKLLAEARESLFMALNAVAAHKLRSALTLLGVLIGVFSIIVVMTSMRVLKTNVETEMSQLGANTFKIQKWPELQFEGPAGWEKFRRRANITLAHGKLVGEKATLATSVGIEEDFWGGQMETRFEKLIGYYQKCSQFEDDLAPESRTKVFIEVFGDLQSLEQEFRSFMETLKSDLDRIRDAAQ